MTCKDAQAKFSEYYDSGDALLDVTEHLKQCHNCNNEYREYKELFTQIRNLPEPALPPNFHENMMNFVNRNKEPKTKRKQIIGWNVAFSAVAAAAVVLFFVWFGGVSEEISQPPIGFMPLEGRMGIDPAGIELYVENEFFLDPLEEYEYQDIEYVDLSTGGLEIAEIDFEPVMFCLITDEPSPARNNNILIIAICFMLLAFGGWIVINTKHQKKK